MLYYTVIVHDNIVTLAIQSTISVSGKAGSPTKGCVLIVYATFTPVTYSKFRSYILYVTPM